MSDELEEAYRSGVWLPEKGRLSSHHGTTAAKVELLTLTNEMKARTPPRFLTPRCCYADGALISPAVMNMLECALRHSAAACSRPKMQL